MTDLTSKELSGRLSKRLANFKLPDAAITKLADRIVVEGLTIGRFNPCIYGICVDYFTSHVPKLEGILGRGGIATVEVFPYGIINPDRFHVRVGYNVDEMAGRQLEGGFGI